MGKASSIEKKIIAERHIKESECERLTFATHDVIIPPKKLRERVAVFSKSDDNGAALARAEAALAELTHEFTQWMEEEVTTLEARWESLRKGEATQDAFAAFYRASHDMRGQAETYGFPLATDIASGICDVLEAFDNPVRLPFPLITAHVRAIRAMVRENVRNRENPIANRLVSELQEARHTLIGKPTQH